MQSNFKYILLTIFLLISMRMAVDLSVLKVETFQNSIENMEPLVIDENIADTQSSVYQIVEKDNSYSTQVYSSFESIASKTVNIDNKIGKDLRKGKEKFAQHLKGHNVPNYIRIVFDNDIFDNTDYYYTNGVRLEYVAPFLSNFSLGGILPSLRNSTINYQGISLTQNIYTPVDPDTKVVANNDRPFSAYLALGVFRESTDIKRGLKIFSELAIGVIGPASMGGKVQSTIHDIEPIGWENQINNDFYLNYNLGIDKLLIGSRKFELSSNASLSVGTVYNKIDAGINMRFGKFDRYIENPLLVSNSENSELKYWIFTRVKGNFVVYDATLQGGLLNRSNPYVIDKNKINNLVLEASAGLAIYYKTIGLELENFYLSPEFKGAYDFRYGRINLIIGF